MVATPTPAPMGQQAPSTRAPASDSWWSLRVARGSLLLTMGTASSEPRRTRAKLDLNRDTEIRRPAPAASSHSPRTKLLAIGTDWSLDDEITGLDKTVYA